MRRALLALAAVLLTACSTQLLSSSQVLDIDSAQGIDPTGNFTVTGAWDLAYTYDCSRQRSEGLGGADGFSFTVFNSDDHSLASEHPELKVKGRNGRGTLHFKRGGIYYVRIDSICDWTLNARELRA